MPRTKSVKTVILELVMYVGVFAVVGHLCENLYERFLMQNEMKNMKSDLNYLQFYVNNIETAYDNLREEIQDLATPGKKTSTSTIPELKPIIKPSYDAYVMQKQRDSNVQTLYKHLVDAKTSFVKTTNDFMQNFLNIKDIPVYSNVNPTQDNSAITERHIKCIEIEDAIDDIKGCKCIIKCIPNGTLKNITKNLTNQEISEHRL